MHNNYAHHYTCNALLHVAPSEISSHSTASTTHVTKQCIGTLFTWCHTSRKLNIVLIDNDMDCAFIHHIGIWYKFGKLVLTNYIVIPAFEMELHVILKKKNGYTYDVYLSNDTGKLNKTRPHLSAFIPIYLAAIFEH